ncbi:MAG: nucleotidyltransferase domain-containing protein [Ignavibacteriaceae bacterium]
MVKIPDKIKTIIENYISLLTDNNIAIKNAYLFGSYAKGNNNEWSDKVNVTLKTTPLVRQAKLDASYNVKVSIG